MALNDIIEAARKARLQLKSDGHALEAESVHRVILSRIMSNGANKSLHRENMRYRALLARAVCVMTGEPLDGDTTGQVVIDIRAELKGKP